MDERGRNLHRTGPLRSSKRQNLRNGNRNSAPPLVNKQFNHQIEEKVQLNHGIADNRQFNNKIEDKVYHKVQYDNPMMFDNRGYLGDNQVNQTKLLEYTSKRCISVEDNNVITHDAVNKNSTNHMLSLGTDQSNMAGHGALLHRPQHTRAEIVLQPVYNPAVREQQPAYSPLKREFQSAYSQPFGEHKLINEERSRNNDHKLTEDSIYSGFTTDSVASGLIRDSPANEYINRSRETLLSVKSVSFQPGVPWEFPKEKLHVRHRIGEGSITEVWQATVDGILGRPGRRVVAVKMLRESFSDDTERYLERELSIMQTLQPHPNIIMLLGCCTRPSQFGPLYVIVEFAPNGSLLGLLRHQRGGFNINNLSRESPMSTRRRHSNLSSRDLVLFALHVANGMEYISSKQLLHRDLAARNVLIDDHLVCKISDIVLASDMAEIRQYESKISGRLPIRWMAPESLLISEYSTKADVWSYGILLWEIMSLGSTPYPGLSGSQILEFVQTGGRTDALKYCPDPINTLMASCWTENSIQRPQFLAIKQRLESMLDPTSEFSCQQVVYVDQLIGNALEVLQGLPGEKC